MLDACYQENFQNNTMDTIANEEVWQPGRILKHSDKLVIVNDDTEILFILVLWLIVAEILEGDRN